MSASPVRQGKRTYCRRGKYAAAAVAPATGSHLLLLPPPAPPPLPPLLLLPGRIRLAPPSPVDRLLNHPLAAASLRTTTACLGCRRTRTGFRSAPCQW